jgi:hypothetical protein
MGFQTHNQERAKPILMPIEEYYVKKKGGKRRKPKTSQNVTVNVKNVMRNDRTMIYPDMYKRQMDSTQNVGRQNLFSGPPLQYASPPQVIYMPHPNMGRASLSDELGVGTNPVQNRHRISVQDDNIAEPILIPVNPTDITQRTPDKRMVPSSQQMPSFSITGSSGVTPQLPSNSLKEGSIPHMHSAGDDMKAESVSFRIEPSEPSASPVEQYAVAVPHESTPASKRGPGRPPKGPGEPKSPYVRKQQ